MDTCVEYVKVAGAELSHGIEVCHIHRCSGIGRGDERSEVGVYFSGVEELVAEGRELRIVHHIVYPEPPAAEHRSNERSKESTDVDKYVEDLETGVTLALCELKFLFSLLGCLSLEIVIHLAYDYLEVALEQTVADGDEKQCEAGKYKQHRVVLGGRHNRECESQVTDCHYDEAGHDGTFVIACTVGDYTSDK